VRVPAFIDLTSDDNNVQNAGVAGVAAIANQSYIVISDDEDDDADSTGAASQNATVYVANNNQDDGAVHTGGKRRATAIVEPARKMRKLDLGKQFALRGIKDARVNPMKSADTRAGLVNSVLTRHPPASIGQPALMLGPDMTDRDSLFVREDSLEPGSGPLTPEYKMFFAKKADMLDAYPSHIRKPQSFGPDDHEYWARFRSDGSPERRRPGPSACRRGSAGAVQSKIVDARRRE
jgi:hypothetical protein